MPIELKTVATFNTLPEAEVAKTKLEWAGIDCVLSKQSLMPMHGWLPTAGKGIELKVPKPDFQRAVKLLNESA